MACPLSFTALQDIQKEMEEHGKVPRCFDLLLDRGWTCPVLRNKMCPSSLVSTRRCWPQGFVDPANEQRWWWLAGGKWIWEDALFPLWAGALVAWNAEPGFSDLVFLPRIHYLLALSMNLAELGRRLLTGQTRLPCEAALVLTFGKESCLCGSGSLARTGMKRAFKFCHPWQSWKRMRSDLAWPELCASMMRKFPMAFKCLWRLKQPVAIRFFFERSKCTQRCI